MDRVTAVLFVLNAFGWIWFLTIRIVEERRRIRDQKKNEVEKVRRIKRVRELSGGL